MLQAIRRKAAASRKNRKEKKKWERLMKSLAREG